MLNARLSRQFASGPAAHFIDCAAGGLADQNGGNITIAAILKLDNTRGGIISLRTSGGIEVANVNTDASQYFYTAGNFQGLVASSTADNWHVFAVGKASGASVPRSHKYVYDTGVWTHADAGGTVNDSGSTVGATGIARLGRFPDANNDNMRGQMLVLGVWNRVLTDGEVELLPFALKHWAALKPDAVWLLNQPHAGLPVRDLTARGANQSAVTGTSVSTTLYPSKFDLQLFEAPRIKAPTSAGNTVTVGQALESDTATALTRSKTRSIGQAAETDTAQAIARAKTRALGPASETDTAVAMGRAKTRLVGVAVETDTADALARSKTRVIGQASESDTALPIGTGNTVILGTAVETNTALALSRSKTKAVGLAQETDSALALTRAKQRAIGAATETDTAQAIGRVKLRTVLTATETDSAIALARAKTRTVGPAVELDTALPVTVPGLTTPGTMHHATAASPTMTAAAASSATMTAATASAATMTGA